MHGRHWRAYELNHMTLFEDQMPDVTAGPVCRG
jgi:hypothetical protein